MIARRRRTKRVYDEAEEIGCRQEREQHLQSTLKEATGLGLNSIR